MFEKKVIWQPVNMIMRGGAEFHVLLDREFAQKMSEFKPGQTIFDRMNELGTTYSKLGEGRGMNPYIFYQDSALVDQINLGYDGKWLAAAETYGKNPAEVGSLDKPVLYSSHNIDNGSEAHTLLSLVDLWVRHASKLIER